MQQNSKVYINFLHNFFTLFFSEKFFKKKTSYVTLLLLFLCYDEVSKGQTAFFASKKEF